MNLEWSTIFTVQPSESLYLIEQLYQHYGNLPISEAETVCLYDLVCRIRQQEPNPIAPKSAFLNELRYKAKFSRNGRYIFDEDSDRKIYHDLLTGAESKLDCYSQMSYIEASNNERLLLLRNAHDRAPLVNEFSVFHSQKSADMIRISCVTIFR